MPIGPIKAECRQGAWLNGNKTLHQRIARFIKKISGLQLHQRIDFVSTLYRWPRRRPRSKICPALVSVCVPLFLSVCRHNHDGTVFFLDGASAEGGSIDGPLTSARSDAAEGLQLSGEARQGRLDRHATLVPPDGSAARRLSCSRVKGGRWVPKKPFFFRELVMSGVKKGKVIHKMMWPHHNDTKCGGLEAKDTHKQGRNEGLCRPRGSKQKISQQIAWTSETATFINNAWCSISPNAES